ncbi:hypothetical protein [Clostridioides difficile]|uniref:hypothetical protein n=1 Tax=Clostridioides difficile TaxID=1496 RepID=UPI001142D027|nr:hypothetical protein [Clostridioides difficile]
MSLRRSSIADATTHAPQLDLESGKQARLEEALDEQAKSGRRHMANHCGQRSTEVGIHRAKTAVGQKGGQKSEALKNNQA